MKNLKKLIVIAAMAALLICLAMACASADERIYTSPVFKLPKDRVEQFAESLPEDAEPDEGTGLEQGTPAEGEPDEGEPMAEAGTGTERRVRVFSTQKDVVSEGDFIYLTSSLEGFEGVDVTFQWQVDRKDGKGWVDVEGATRSKHSFVANKETVRYSWRLVVNVDE